MELIQQVDIPAAVPLVWLALNDPEVLKQSLTGCESFTENASGGYENGGRELR
jgi:carbon monoxide dehydrogenase subunit G